MVKVCVFLAVLLFQKAWYGADSSSAAQVLGDLPTEVIKEILTILAYGIVKATGDCSDARNASQVQYCLFTRENPKNPIIVTSIDQIKSSKPVKFLIHGWGGNCEADYIHVIKKAYLDCSDYNIISVDFHYLANASYSTAYCQVPAIGKKVGQFICNVSTTLNISMSDIHVVGHSLGGQIAGFAGNETQKICGSIGRVTALDPAGPLYQDVDKSKRLDKSDATFVDVIHTNQGLSGYIGDCGHVDFYPNCGYFQPGCKEQAINATTGMEEILGMVVADIRCSHQRSCYLFAESINSNSFLATSCTACGTSLCTTDTSKPDETYMGESCSTKPEKEEYTLSTRKTSPYSLGPQGPPNCKN